MQIQMYQQIQSCYCAHNEIWSDDLFGFAVTKMLSAFYTSLSSKP